MLQGLPPWATVILIAVVFTAVLSIGQGGYWAWVSRQESKQKELLRRLGNPAEMEKEDEGLFFDLPEDATAQALGGIGDRLQELVTKADVNYSVSTLLTRCGILFAFAFVTGGLFFGPLGMAAGVPAGILPIFLLNRSAEARTDKLVELLPDTLDLMSRSLQAGLGLSDALRLVAEEMPMPVSGEFGRVFEEVRFGRDYRDAFQKMIARNPGVFDLRLMVSSIMLQRETGGNLIEILASISGTIRARFVFQAKVRAMTAEAKMSAVILGSLPLLVISGMTVANPDYLTPLFETSIGNLMLLYCITSYAVGIFVMRDMTNVEV